jgi:hypothetical protein
LRPAPWFTLEYHGTNSVTRSSTSGRAGVGAGSVKRQVAALFSVEEADGQVVANERGEVVT